MNKLTLLLFLTGLTLGCAGGGDAGETAQPAQARKPLIKVENPEPLEVPELRAVTSDTDWEAKTHNKEREIIEVINILNPVAAYITEGFKQYGDRFSETLHEEWTDTQNQLTAGLELYEDCKKRKASGAFDKKLFLDLEQSWQLLVKTGVAGVRAKTMVDGELRRMTGQ